MANLHHAVIFEHISGRSEDRYINNFYTEGPGLALAEATLAQENLEQFYNDIHGTAANDLCGILSSVVSRAALSARVRTWEVNLATKVETFVSERLWTPNAPSDTTPYDSEAAIVLSFHAELDGSAQDRRRRGRIYFGPLATVAVQTAADGVARPNPAATLILREAAMFLESAMDIDAMDWVVYSRTYGEMNNVVGGWTDDALDAQRRRGEAPIARTTYTTGV